MSLLIQLQKNLKTIGNTKIITSEGYEIVGKNILFDKDFFNLKISPIIRSEALTIDQFIKLENYVTQNNINFDC